MLRQVSRVWLYFARGMFFRGDWEQCENLNGLKEGYVTMLGAGSNWV